MQLFLVHKVDIAMLERWERISLLKHLIEFLLHLLSFLLNLIAWSIGDLALDMMNLITEFISKLHHARLLILFHSVKVRL